MSLLSPMKVLIVDDDRVDREFCRKAIEKSTVLNCDLVFASDGNSVLETCANTTMDCILLDYNLPGKDGLAVAKELNDLGNEATIVLMTGQGSEGLAAKAMDLGINNYIIKGGDYSENLITTLLRIQENNMLRSELKEKDKEIYYRAHYDHLTRLSNRYAFRDMAISILSDASRHNRLCAMLFIDIDGFKLVNDSFGHSAGDEMLKETGNRIVSVLRREDIKGRWGGDEFVVLLVGLASPLQAGKIAKKIIDVIEMEYKLKAGSAFVSASIGITMFPHSGKTVDELIQRADVSLYRAKSRGKGCYEYFSEKLNESYVRKVEVEKCLHEGIKLKEFSLVYQPQHALPNYEIVGFEALLRWDSAILGPVPPEDFISVAEESGLILTIGELVLEESIENLVKWKKEFPSLKKLVMAINISPQQIYNEILINKLHEVFLKNDVDPSSLELEITESKMNENLNESKLIKYIKKSSMQLAIDDFGTGHSSLYRLNTLPITTLKVDQSFVQSIDKGKNRAIIRSIINLGKDLSMNVIAEGVETKDQLDFLVKCNCPQVQGYYFSKPLSSDEVINYLSEKE